MNPRQKVQMIGNPLTNQFLEKRWASARNYTDGHNLWGIDLVPLSHWVPQTTGVHVPNALHDHTLDTKQTSPSQARDKGNITRRAGGNFYMLS